MAKLQSGTRIYGTASTDGKLTANSITLSGGTTTIAPLTFTSGTSLSTQTAGSMEYDGVNMYVTPESTAGRGAVGAFQQFVVTADTNITTAASLVDYFGTTSSLNLLASSYYDIQCFCYFIKITTASAITWTPTVSSAATMINSFYQATPIVGYSTTISTGAPLFGQASILTNTAAAHAATGSLTAGNSQIYFFRIKVLTNLACNFRLKFNQAAAGMTVKAGSFYTARRVSGNAGNFVA